MYRKIEIIIPAQYDGRDIKSYLKSELFMSQRLIAKLKRDDDGILLNGESVYVVKKMSVGDILTLKLSDEDDYSENIVPTRGDFEIVYEDDDLILINKPAGLSVHPSMGNFYETLANYVAHHYMERGEKMTFRPINRLDKNTSGLMLVAKNSYAQDFMAREHKEGRLKREYLALVKGNIKNDGEIIAPIARADASAIKRTVSADGKYAQTQFYVVRSQDAASMVRVVPKTGRTHQIRVHFSHIGHPLLGDFLYGMESDIISRHALHSYRISFRRPFTLEEMFFEIELPSDMKKTADELL